MFGGHRGLAREKEKATNVAGTFGRLRVPRGERPALLMPAGAVRRTGQLETVGLVRGDRVVRRLVKTVDGPGEQREAISGLAAGDRVLVPGGGGSAG